MRLLAGSVFPLTCSFACTASVIISSNLRAASFRRVICSPNSKMFSLLKGVMGKLHSGIAKISDNGQEPTWRCQAACSFSRRLLCGFMSPSPSPGAAAVLQITRPPRSGIPCSSKKHHSLSERGPCLPREGLFRCMLHGWACLAEETGLEGLEVCAPAAAAAAAAAAASLAFSSLLLCSGAPPRPPKLRRGFAAFTTCIHM